MLLLLLMVLYNCIYCTRQGVKIRLRGIGSGFMEGREELQEPLHFAISASHEAILEPVCQRVYELVQSAHAEGLRDRY